jgi:hypothetical protein
MDTDDEVGLPGISLDNKIDNVGSGELSSLSYEGTGNKMLVPLLRNNETLRYKYSFSPQYHYFSSTLDNADPGSTFKHPKTMSFSNVRVWAIKTA